MKDFLDINFNIYILIIQWSKHTLFGWNSLCKTMIQRENTYDEL